jgi:hypothetical protein
MEDRHENGAFDIEFEIAPLQVSSEDIPKSGLLPQPLENQRRADLLGIGADIFLSGKDQQNIFRIFCQRADKPFHLAFFMKLIQTADGGDYALSNFPVLPAAFYDLKVLVFAGFFDSREHGSLLAGHFQINLYNPYKSRYYVQFCGTTFWRFYQFATCKNKGLSRRTRAILSKIS